MSNSTPDCRVLSFWELTFSFSSSVRTFSFSSFPWAEGRVPHQRRGCKRRQGRGDTYFSIHASGGIWNVKSQIFRLELQLLIPIWTFGIWFIYHSSSFLLPLQRNGGEWNFNSPVWLGITSILDNFAPHNLRPMPMISANEGSCMPLS